MRVSFLKKFFISILAVAVVAGSIPAGTVYAKTTVKRASWSLSKLSASERHMYDHLISELERILREGGSTKITFDISQDGLTSGDQVSDLWKKLYTYASNNHPELLCYEEINPDEPNEDNIQIAGDFSQFTVFIGVDKSYRGADEFTLDSLTLQKVTTAESTAEQVISDNSGKGIYDTIKVYADWISEHVSYDHYWDSTPDSEITSNSPWSMIAVFDNDPSTNVVCEGYSKAFQYLMDHTQRFVDAGIVSKLVTSTKLVDGNDNGHMWNVVTIDGKNYIVDVTWYDNDSDSYNDSYLLGGQATVDADTEGYHTYDQDTTDFYTQDELQLSDTAFDRSSEKPATVVTGPAVTGGGDTSTGGDTPTGGNTSGTSGNTSGNRGTTGGNTSGNSGTTGGNTSGNSGTTRGNTSGNSSSNSGNTGNNSGSTGNTQTGGNTSGSTGNTSTNSTSGTTGNSSTSNNTSGSTSGNRNNSGLTNSTTDNTPVSYNTAGAIAGGDSRIGGSSSDYWNTDSSNDISVTRSSSSSSTSKSQINSIQKKKGGISMLTAGSRKLTLTIKKTTVSGKTVKYQTAIKQPKAKNWQKAYVSGTKVTFKNLKKEKTYWISVRPYITVNGVRYFGKWSKTLVRKAK